MAGAADAMEDDGRLTADEVYGLRLRARLVVLSACRTALGPLSGDGVIGFTRAFLYAGASSVVATSWDVPDEAGYEVMRRFYRARAADERRGSQAGAATGRNGGKVHAASARSTNAGASSKVSARATMPHTADALRTAQLAVLASLRKGTLMATTPAGPVALREHPLLWAGFLVVGEP
jgi:CHAT domain-containing protein